jgi:hypothetical protein
LIRQPTAAVHDAVRQIGHALLRGGRPEQASQNLELHVTDAALDAQVTLDGVLEQTADLDEREVGRQLVWIEGGRHGPRTACFEFAAVLPCASNMKQLIQRTM